MAWGYINKTGQEHIKLKFLCAFEFVENIACVKEEKGYTYIDLNGNYLFNKYFDVQSDFFFTRARLSEKKLTGYINIKGEWAILPTYHVAGNFRSGLACVRKGMKSFYIDINGAIAIDPDCAKANDFSCGLARISYKGKVYYINNKGKKVLGPFDEGDDFYDGVAAIVKNNKDYLIDTNGKYLFEYNPANISPYCINNRVAFKQDDKYGFLDRSGKVVIDPIYDEVSLFHNELAIICRGKKKGLIDVKGHVLFESELKVLDNVNEGMCVFSEDKKRYGFCDTKGNIAINPKWSYARSFSCGFAAVSNEPL